MRASNPSAGWALSIPRRWRWERGSVLPLGLLRTGIKGIPHRRPIAGSIGGDRPESQRALISMASGRIHLVVQDEGGGNAGPVAIRPNGSRRRGGGGRKCNRLAAAVGRMVQRSEGRVGVQAI